MHTTSNHRKKNQRRSKSDPLMLNYQEKTAEWKEEKKKELVSETFCTSVSDALKQLHFYWQGGQMPNLQLALLSFSKVSS